MADEAVRRQLLAKSSVHQNDVDSAVWVIAETPGEVMAAIDRASDDAPWVTLTLANDSGWNGRHVYMRASTIIAVAPPVDMDD